MRRLLFAVASGCSLMEQVSNEFTCSSASLLLQPAWAAAAGRTRHGGGEGRQREENSAPGSHPQPAWERSHWSPLRSHTGVFCCCDTLDSPRARAASPSNLRLGELAFDGAQQVTAAWLQAPLLIFIHFSPRSSRIEASQRLHNLYRYTVAGAEMS